MKVVLVAHDVAPSDCFNRVGKRLAELNHEAAAFIDNGKPFAGNSYDIVDSINKADAVLIGMSSSEKLAETELIAAQAASACNVPFGFYADTFGCHNRPWFELFRPDAAFLFVINEKEAESAAGVFPNAKVCVAGNPTWEDFFDPRPTSSEVRQKLGIPEDARVVMCPGGKCLVVNTLHLGGVIEAVSRLGKDLSNWHILFAKHPGDQNTNEAYTDLVQNSPSPLRIVMKEEMTSSNLLSAADVIVESASTIGIEAACCRKPVVEYFTEVALRRLEKMTGTRDWELCRIGAARQVVGNPNQLANEIFDLLMYGDAAKLRKVQEQAFPAPPAKGEAVVRMISALEQYSTK